MAADGDLSYGSYQDDIPLSMQYINISSFKWVITQIKMLNGFEPQKSQQSEYEGQWWAPPELNRSQWLPKPQGYQATPRAQLNSPICSIDKSIWFSYSNRNTEYGIGNVDYPNWERPPCMWCRIPASFRPCTP